MSLPQAALSANLGRVESLRARHAALSSLLEQEQLRPGADTAGLKRLKLRLKDQITEMENN